MLTVPPYDEGGTVVNPCLLEAGCVIRRDALNHQQTTTGVAVHTDPTVETEGGVWGVVTRGGYVGGGGGNRGGRHALSMGSPVEGVNPRLLVPPLGIPLGDELDHRLGESDLLDPGVGLLVVQVLLEGPVGGVTGGAGVGEGHLSPPSD